MADAGLIERVIGVFSPRLARHRLSERLALAQLRRGYEGAARGRGTAGWRTSGTSADAEIGRAAATLRDRMRDLVRNNAVAAQAVQVLVNNIVGTGIRPRAISADPQLNRRVDALWQAWSAEADAHGHTDFHGLLTLAVREMIEGGDLFALRRPQPARRGLTVPLQIELREADHLDDGKSAQLDGGGRISHGIETDAAGRRVAYWMFPEHPGDSSPLVPRSWQPVRIPADGVAHLFERQRVQARGVPWGAPAVRALRDVDDWQHAELVRKKTEACFVGIVIGDDEAGVAGVSARAQLTGNQLHGPDGRVVEEFTPGMLAYSSGARDVKFNQPASTGGVYEWHRVQLHIIAAGFRVPYALMTGDLSQTNFSSSRVGLNEFRRMVEAVQWQTVVPMLCMPIWRWFVAAAQLAGRLPEGPVPVEWAPPRFESVNPLQDAQADLLEVRAGFSTLSQQIARRGYDPQEVFTEWKKDAAALDGAGLVFDSDPRRVSKVGVAQTVDDGATREAGANQE